MRLGLIGPAKGDVALLEEAADFLLDEVGVPGVLYLGIDDTVQALASAQPASPKGPLDETTVRTAIGGSVDELRELTRTHRRARRLQCIQTVPYPPTRAVEMLDDRIVMIVYDKGVLDEEDIINASLVIYGNSQELFVKRFGPRVFFTPGPLHDRKVGVLHHEPDGQGAIEAYDLDGSAVFREPLHGRSAKVMVST